MNYKVAAYTDPGLKKSTNQDAYSVRIAETDFDTILFAVVCDGVGGLKKGELSSATVVRTFTKWFERDFPVTLRFGIDVRRIARTWVDLTAELNLKINDYGSKCGMRTGTTAAMLMLIGKKALFATVGDSRIYHYHQGELRLISKDQTVAQREFELGRITADELRTDRRSHILLQCIGASPKLNVEVTAFDYESGDIFQLCTDGFYRRLEEKEIAFIANPLMIDSETSMNNALSLLSALVKSRNESDNITSVTVKAE